ncbi:Hint domain-containing protein [Lentibacter algarum]|uniref:Hint domain-containing protein n=1 Tax=Lentibacter algarum TaxID=576131 RepID=UPI001C0788CD|nr:Hint domain-containing protein [Lentibacter algarum]MBU2981503.1 Hint domain-containing protein [Lentibacter algarum]
MPTTFSLFYLGTAPEIDTTEGNLTSENHAALETLTFGGPGDEIAFNLQELSDNPSNNWNGGTSTTAYDSNNSTANETFSIDGGPVQTHDATMLYNNTLITYTDGSTATVNAIVMQDTAGNLYLLPPTSGPNAYSNALEARPIESVTLGTAAPSGGTDTYGMSATRYELNLSDYVVEGTSAGELIDASYAGDSEGDVIDGGDHTDFSNDDSVHAGAGNDTIISGLGDDTVEAGTGTDSVDAGAGNDSVFAGSGDDEVLGGTGNDTVFGSDGADTLLGGAGDDTLDGDDGLAGGAADSIDGGAGNDQIIGDYGNDTLDGGSGRDTIFAGDDDDSVSGGTGNDVLYGEAGEDTIYGNDGDDRLYGGDDNDQIYAGNGNDTVEGGDGDDYVSAGAGHDSVLGGAGSDNLQGGAGNDTLDGGADGDNINAGDGDDSIIGADGNDSIWGAAGDDTIDAGSGNDALYGGTGDDSIDAGAGNDYISMTSGADTVDAGDDQDNIHVIAGAYADGEVVTLTGGTGGVDSDTLTLTSWVSYSNLVQSVDPDSDSTSGSVDLLDASGNTVTVNFSEIENLNLPAPGLDYIVEGTAAGDLIDASYTTDPDGDMIDNSDHSDGSNDDSIEAGAGEDTIIAGLGDDTVSADDGNDIVSGMEGDDSIDGGAGNDVLHGDNGDASSDSNYISQGSFEGISPTSFGQADNLSDWYNWNTASPDLSEQGGYEASYSTAAAPTDGTNYVSMVNNGNGTFQEGISQDLASPLIAGNTYTIVLDAASGGYNNSSPTGDNLQLLVYGNETAGQTLGNASGGPAGATLLGATDVTVDYTTGTMGQVFVTFTPTTDIETISLSLQDSDFNGNFAVLTIDNIYLYEGVVGDDTINGGAGDDTIFGEAGDDVLDGGIGDDALSGGAGNDSVLGDTGNDSIDSDAGDDTVRGGMGNDTIDGGAGDDSIYGNEDDDSITGGLGNDSLYGEEGNDIVSGGDGDDHLEGNEGNDTLSGGAGDDWIRGSYGEDSITSDAGDDFLWGGYGDDTFTYTDGFGNDTIEGEEAQETDGDTLDLSGVTSDLTVDLTSANPETGSFTDGTDTVSFVEIENIILGGGDDTLVLGTGSGADTVQGFSIPTGSAGAYTGHDVLDVSTLVDTNGAPVNTDDVTLSTDGNGDAVLTFPSGESLTLVGVTEASITDPEVLEAMGIPMPNYVVDGTAGGDLIDGTYITDPEGDVIDGNDNQTAGNEDSVEAGAGDDTVFSYAGNDTIDAGAGNDSVDAGDADDVVSGGAGNDTLQGWFGDDSLDGGAGDDSLMGWTGDDTLSGGEGDDSIEGGDDQDVILLENGFGDDTIDGGDGGTTDYDTLDMSAVTTDTTVDLTSANPESGSVTSGADTATFADIENIVLGAGTDTVVLADGSGSDTVDGFEAPTDNGDGTYTGNDQLDVSGMTDANGDPVNVTDVTVTDTNGDGTGDAILTFPNGESVTLVGVSPSDVDSHDELEALGIPGTDYIVEGTSGSDTIDSSYLGDPDGDMIDNNDMSDGSNNDSVLAGDGHDSVVSGLGSDTVWAGSGNDIVEGGAGSDVLYGESGDDNLHGGTGDDTLIGGAGEDEFYGGTGDDLIDGGDDEDRFILANDFGNDTIVGGEGGANDDDSIRGTDVTDDLTVIYTGDEAGTYSDGSSTATFSEIEGVWTGSGDDLIDADASTSQMTIQSGEGADTIHSGSGDDYINVSGDTFAGDNAVDTIVFSDGDGDDTVMSFEAPTDLGGGSYTGHDQLDVSGLTDANGDPVNVHDVTVTDTNGDGTGDAILSFPNGESITLVGVDPADVDSYGALEALGIPGTDEIVSGTAGGDVINGSYTGDPDGDMVDAGDNAAGNDDDVIEAGAGNDTISGGAGADYIDAGAGDDQILLQDGDTAHGGDGDDHFSISGSNGGTISVTGGEGGETAGDTLDFNGLIDFGDITYTNTDPGVGGGMSGSATLSDGTVVNFDEIENVIICFTEGTRIATPRGARDVADLAIGDMVVTRDHGLQPISWVGKRTVPAVGKLAPIRFAPNTVGNERELLVSPQHRMLIQGAEASLLFGKSEVLASAKHLVNGGSVVEQHGGDVTYVHIMFDQHEIVYAEGAASESFYPGGTGLDAVELKAREELFTLFPELRSHEGSYGDTARLCLKSYESRLFRLS